MTFLFLIGPLSSPPSLDFENPNTWSNQLLFCILIELKFLPHTDKLPPPRTFLECFLTKFNCCIPSKWKAYFIPIKTISDLPTLTRFWGWGVRILVF